MNTDAPWPTLDEAWPRVLGIQAKLHRWATDNADRRFDDLFNLVADPAFLVVAWERVRGNRGARSAGVDGVAPRSFVFARDTLLPLLRDDLKAGRFAPLPVRERMIPKASGKLRRLGIPTTRDRIVQASLKLVLEPIFEAHFYPSSYGFRPSRRTQDAIAEIHQLATRSYEWVLEGDIEACFDRIDHTALMGLVWHRIGDRRVLGLVKAFLKAGILTEDGVRQDSLTGTPQGGILSPLLANIALSVLDDHFAEAWERFGTSSARSWRRHKGEATYRLVRYADDFVVMVAGTREHAEGLRDEVAAVLSNVGLVLSEEKTRIVHIDEGFDFLGFRIQRQPQRGSGRLCVYTFPSKKALASVKAKVKATTRMGTSYNLADLIDRLNPILRGWTAYFRHSSAKATFAYLRSYAWNRVVGWLRRKHRRIGWKQLRRRYFAKRWWPEQDGVVMFDPSSMAVTRYRWRGYHYATPWTQEISAVG